MIASIKVGDIAEIVSGFAFESTFFTEDSTKMPLIRIRDISRGETKTFYSGEYGPEFVVHAGELLISMDGEFYIAPWQGRDALLNQRVCKISPKDGAVIDSYLKYFLPKKLKEIEDRTPFVTVKHLSAKKIREIAIPLPSLNEQKHIVSILDQADALRRKRAEAIRLLDEYVQAVFMEMFGDPVTNPKGWETLRFDQIGNFNSGGTPSKQRKEFWVGTFPWVSPKDMKRFYIDDSIDHINDIAFEETSLKRIPVNTLLIVVRGMILVHSFPVAINRVSVAINQDMKAIELDTSLRPLFAKIALDCMKSKILSHVSTAAHGTKRFDAEGMKKIFVPVPPLDLQDQFCTKLALAQKTNVLMQTQSQEMDNQFNALMQKTFALAI